jgi:hypothetical protein
MFNYNRVEACNKVNRLNKNKSSLNIKIVESSKLQIWGIDKGNRKTPSEKSFVTHQIINRLTKCWLWTPIGKPLKSICHYSNETIRSNHLENWKCKLVINWCSRETKINKLELQDSKNKLLNHIWCLWTTLYLHLDFTHWRNIQYFSQSRVII